MKMTGKKNLALLELIVVILFFALSSVILAQVFVKAAKMSDLSRAETQGLVLAQDLLEQLKAAPEEAENILTAEGGWQKAKEPDGLSYTAVAELSAPEAAYEVQVTISEEPRAAGSMFYIKVRIERQWDHERITELSTARYVSENRR